MRLSINDWLLTLLTILLVSICIRRRCWRDQSRWKSGSKLNTSTNNHRSAGLKLQTDGRFLRGSAASKRIQTPALLSFGAMNLRTIPRMYYP